MYATFWLYRVLDFDQIAACSPCKIRFVERIGPTVFDLLIWNGNVKVRLHSRITRTWNKFKLIQKMGL